MDPDVMVDVVLVQPSFEVVPLGEVEVTTDAVEKRSFSFNSSGDDFVETGEWVGHLFFSFPKFDSLFNDCFSEFPIDSISEIFSDKVLSSSSS